MTSLRNRWVQIETVLSEPIMPNASPSVSQCNMARIRYARGGFALFFCIFFAFGTQTLPNANAVFSGIWTYG